MPTQKAIWDPEHVILHKLSHENICYHSVFIATIFIIHFVYVTGSAHVCLLFNNYFILLEKKAALCEQNSHTHCHSWCTHMLPLLILQPNRHNPVATGPPEIFQIPFSPSWAVFRTTGLLDHCLNLEHTNTWHWSESCEIQAVHISSWSSAWGFGDSLSRCTANDYQGSDLAILMTPVLYQVRRPWREPLHLFMCGGRMRQ